MKRITYIIVLLFCTTVVQAQKIDIDYYRLIFPFEWRIIQIECSNNQTLIKVKVRNVANVKETIDFSHGERICSVKHPFDLKSTENSFVSLSGKTTLPLMQNREASFTLSFPTNTLITEDHFALTLCDKYELEGITIPQFSLEELNQQMLTWDQYYLTHKKVEISHYTISDIKNAIQQDVESWQKKGEFESTSAWQNRVNDNSRQLYIDELTKKYTTQHELEVQQAKTEQVNLASDYEKYKEDLLNIYYQQKISRKINQFKRESFELKPYDADNETFLVHSSIYGDILLPVPVTEAPSFKKNWSSIRNTIKPEYVPNGEDVILTKLIFSNNYSQYIYDSHTTANYAITDVNYNFAPIEIAEIDFNDIHLDEVKPIQDNISSSLIAVNNNSSSLENSNSQMIRRKIDASEKSNVDTSIPKNKTISNSTTFAVIIANENYHNVSPVPYAENDGKILSKYLTDAAGLPKDHVKVYNNATFGNFAAAMKHIDNLSKAFGDQLNLIFYYAGHGVPNERTKQCMLLPVDGDASIPETCYDVDKLYSNLGNLNANAVIVLMDACFSGSIRGDGMLIASRSVKIRSNNSEPKGRMVVFSASQGDETAFPYEKERHGMFTYFLLKSIQDSNGDITLGNLSDKVIEHVKKQSVVTNGKIQTPAVQYSPTIESDWRTWKLNQ